jgi:hypothetical protein
LEPEIEYRYRTVLLKCNDELNKRYNDLEARTGCLCDNMLESNVEYPDDNVRHDNAWRAMRTIHAIRAPFRPLIDARSAQETLLSAAAEIERLSRSKAAQLYNP